MEINTDVKLLRKQYDDLCGEYLRFRNVVQPHFPAITKDQSEALKSWLIRVNDFLKRASKLDSKSHLYRLAVTTRNRAHEVISHLREFEQGETENTKMLTEEVLSFPNKFSYETGRQQSYQFHADFFSQHVENWKSDLSKLMMTEGNRVLEIGCFEGFSTCWLIDNLLHGPSSEIVCIDPFDGYWSRMFEYNVMCSGKARQVTIYKGRSQDILRRLPSFPKFNLIHIDGSHDRRDCLEDIVLSWNLLNPGGIVIIDDYKMRCDETASFPVQEAVDVFLKFYSNSLLVKRLDHQVVVEKRDDSK